jgi:aspartate racemase
MSPLAHVEFERRLIQQNLERGVTCDQDHPVWILINAANIPDRTRSLMGETEDCTPWLLHYGRLLERAGADFLIVTCNTCHAFYDRVQPQLQIPWMHSIDQTVQSILQTSSARRIGILATDGTLKTELYSRSLRQVGLTPIAPPLGSIPQAQVMQAIYHPDWGIKNTGVQVSEQAQANLQQTLAWLQQQGAEVVIAGCTELSVAFSRMNNLCLPWLDPLEVMATLTLDLVSGQRSLQSVWAA